MVVEEQKSENKNRRKKVIRIKSQNKSTLSKIQCELKVETKKAEKKSEESKKETHLLVNPFLDVLKSPDLSFSDCGSLTPNNLILSKCLSAQPESKDLETELNDFSLLSEHSCIADKRLHSYPLPLAPRFPRKGTKLFNLKGMYMI